ncbi:MAG: L-seryl-tRNA(Sec) selenium transferase, partial [Sterolibacteriaceae bacterium]|nr:L-seryl-tRNA(Sec) selenium transferase [Sterolibacteriaceae bacterium]
MNPLSLLPSVDRLLSAATISSLIDLHGRASVTGVVREVLGAAREAVKQGGAMPSEDALITRVGAGVTAKTTPKLRPVFNLTGTVLHTNLGRAPLPEEAVQALIAAARSPCALEYDIASGGRGDRDSVVDELLCELTGAEAATVVNNNAAAVLLTLA